MKYHLKNLMILTLLVLTVFIVPCTVLANNNDPTPFDITSGIAVDKNKEATFDIERTITGKASRATQVAIYVYNANDVEYELSVGIDEQEAKENLAKYYEFNVGKSRIFSQTIDLAIGENTIEIIVKEEGKETVTYMYIVNRKRSAIKSELEKTIVLPGGLK